MPNFCVKCGSPLSGGPFCVKCGADTRNLVSPAPVQPSQPLLEQVQVPQPAQITAATVGPSTSLPPKQGMSALAKLGIAAVAIIFVGGAAGVAGVYYVAHRVSQKIHQTEDRILGSSASCALRRSWFRCFDMKLQRKLAALTASENSFGRAHFGW